MFCNGSAVDAPIPPDRCRDRKKIKLSVPLGLRTSAIRDFGGGVRR